VSKSRAKTALETGGPDLERRGRLLGIALFWLLLFYMIAMSSRSIIPAVFWPGQAPVAQAPGGARCAGELATLDRQLLVKTAGAVRSGEVAKLRQWLGTWDKRALALAGACGTLEHAREDLVQLRSELGVLLDAYENGPLQTQQRIRRALDSAAPASSPPPPPGPE
jgi:hypothetical protein